MSFNFLAKLGLSLLILMFILTGCGSSPTQKSSQQLDAVPAVTETVVSTPERNSQYYIKKAQKLNADEGRGLYISALRYAIAEQRPMPYIMAIVEQVDPSKYNSVNLDIDLARSLLLAAEQNEELNEDAKVVLTRLNQGNVNAQYKLDLWLLKMQLESNNQQHLKVVRTYYRIHQLHQHKLTIEHRKLLDHLLWKHLPKVSITALKQFQNDFGESATRWISLAQIIKQNLTDAEQLPKQLAFWQRRFGTHQPDKHFLPEHIQALLSIRPYQPKHYALLLPMSGKLQRQAESIRNGFFAATDLSNETKITVIDTEKYSMAEIKQNLETSGVDFIVGPLLKENVEAFLQSDILPMVPRLYLNTPELMPLTTFDQQRYFFSLAPEDEIEQAVEFFLNNQYNNPTLIYADNSLGRRLAGHFNQLWRQATDKEVESIAFKSKSKLGEAVEELLDVNLSKQRIAEMKQLFGTALETAARSRTDIDAVYIIANSQQTRLIKPFFDVNVSVFGERLPIFGSSRSYLVDESQSQKRDLNELTFTEMPWLIRNKARDLHNLYAKVGEQQTQLKKLFAFGFDAQRLIFALKQLETLPDQSFDGLTGRLAVTPNKRVKRDLEWSRYEQGRIIAVAQTEN